MSIKPYPKDRREQLADRIALQWLRNAEEKLARGEARPASLTRQLAFAGPWYYIRDSEHAELGSGEYDGYTLGPRVSRQIAQRAKRVAGSYLRAGLYPLTLAHFAPAQISAVSND